MNQAKINIFFRKNKNFLEKIKNLLNFKKNNYFCVLFNY